MGGVAVEYLDIMPGLRHAEAVGGLRHRREVDRDQDKAAVSPPAQPGQHRMFAVVAVDPLEAVAGKILFMQGRRVAIEPVEVGRCRGGACLRERRLAGFLGRGDDERVDDGDRERLQHRLGLAQLHKHVA